MINLDLSKALHPRFWDLVPALMPGLFFEICIFYARPELIDSLVTSPHLPRYLQIIIAVIIAFIIGNAFMFWVRTIQIVFVSANRRINPLWRWLRKRLVDVTDPSGLFRIVHIAHRKTFLRDDIKGVKEAWQKAAAQVLKHRYGIEPPGPLNRSEWKAWASVLGNPRKSAAFRGGLSIMAAEATGWSGLAAAYYAPHLRTTPYFVFSGFLILTGISFDWNLARRWTREFSSWIIGLHTILPEIPQPGTHGGDQEDGRKAL